MSDNTEEQDNEHEEQPLIPRLEVYPQRWYILAVFSLLIIVQGVMWATWSPIADAAKVAFGWDTPTISLLLNWGNIMYLVAAAPIAWIMDVKGLRWAGIISSALVFVGAGIRCITSEPEPQTWLAHISAILNGMAAPMCQAGPPLLSSVWFPPDQRTTATAISIAAAGVGSSIPFLLGPALVPAVNSSSVEHTNGTGVQITREKIMELMYMEAGMAALVFVMFIIYFPAKPKIPPSITATTERVEFKTGFKQLIRQPQFWSLGTVYAVSTGVTVSWSSVIAINLQPLGVSMWDSGMIGFWSMMAALVAGLAVGFISDVFARRMKLILIVMFVFAAVMFLLFSLVCIKVIPFHIAWLYVTCILGNVGMSGVALFYELVCESTYPISEGITNITITLFSNIVCIVFYLILMAPIGTSWMNWANLGSVTICIPLLVLYKESYRRLDLDQPNTGANENDDEILK